MNIETQAINTNGLWYAYVSVDGKTVYSGNSGFANREDAIEDGRNFLEANADGFTGE